jgi:hypothetical protein
MAYSFINKKKEKAKKVGKEFVIRKGAPSSSVYKNFLTVLMTMLLDHDVELILRRYRADKTGKQRRYVHACIQQIADHCGYIPAELKIDIKIQLGLINDVTVDGKTYALVRSTEDLTVDDYGVFITGVLKMADQLDSPEAPFKLKNPAFFGCG